MCNSARTKICAKKLKWNSKTEEPGIIWEGEGINEIGRRSDNNEIIIRIDPNYFRPSEVDLLLGDPSKAKTKLGWEPKIKLEEMISEMIEQDKINAKKEFGESSSMKIR